MRVLSLGPCQPRAFRYCGAIPARDEQQDSTGSHLRLSSAQKTGTQLEVKLR